MTPGNGKFQGFFQSAITNRASLIPANSYLLRFANKAAGQGIATKANSRIATSQVNGAGPLIPPVTAPWNFTSFITGAKPLLSNAQKLVKKRVGLK